MAKKKKEIRPFFKVRFEVNDTLEALAHEIMMTVQTLQTLLDIGGLNETTKKIVQERLDGLKAVCMSDEGAADEY
jgi:hypothetical protein